MRAILLASALLVPLIAPALAADQGSSPPTLRSLEEQVTQLQSEMATTQSDIEALRTEIATERSDAVEAHSDSSVSPFAQPAPVTQPPQMNQPVPVPPP